MFLTIKHYFYFCFFLSVHCNEIVMKLELISQLRKFHCRYKWRACAGKRLSNSTRLLLVSSDRSIWIFSARFGGERTSWVLVPFVWTRPVWLLWHSHAHTVCTHHQVWTKCRLNALTCSGNAPCWCNFVTCGRDQVHLNNSCIKIHYSARSEQCLYFNRCDGDVNQCDHDRSSTGLILASNISKATFRWKWDIYCYFTIFITL